MSDVSAPKGHATEDGMNDASAHAEALNPQASQSSSSEYRIRLPQLPLAVYREVAAHLRQIEDVDAGLLPQTSQTFEYLASQVGGLWISYHSSPNLWAQQRVEMVLSYYSDRFGAWEVV